MKISTFNFTGRWKIIALLPLSGIFFWAFTEPECDNPKGQDFRSIVIGTNDSIDFAIDSDPGNRNDSVSQVDDSRHFSLFHNPLYVVDGKKVWDIDEITPNMIESVSALKSEDAIKAYGKRGRNGAVLITTKKEAARKSGSDKNTLDSSLIIRPDIHFANTAGRSNPALLLLNGVEIKSMGEVNPEDIEHVSALNEEAAMEIYGEKGKNGVILITTKKKSE